MDLGEISTSDHMAATKLSEAAIKAMLLSLLRKEGVLNRTSIVANEFSLGSFSYRADLAILTNKFIGIEIKSELDSLRRLVDQTQGYLAYFDKVIVVLATKHINAVDLKALKGADIWEITNTGEFVVHAFAPTRAKIERKPFSDLMTQAEKRIAFRGLEKLSTNVTVRRDQEREAFYAAFKQRFESTSSAFWRAIGSRNVKVRDLALLSRYRDARESRAQWRAAQAEATQKWLEKAQRCFA